MTVLETPPFVVSQPQPPAVQLRLENAVLFPQEFQNIALLPLKPAEQRGDEHVQRKHSRSLRGQSSTQFADTTGAASIGVLDAEGKVVQRVPALR
jgi:hypothetical protein